MAFEAQFKRKESDAIPDPFYLQIILIYPTFRGQNSTLTFCENIHMNVLLSELELGELEVALGFCCHRGVKGRYFVKI